MGRWRRPWIIRPRMARIATLQFAPNLGVGALPEALQILGHLDRSPRRGRASHRAGRRAGTGAQGGRAARLRTNLPRASVRHPREAQRGTSTRSATAGSLALPQALRMPLRTSGSRKKSIHRSHGTVWQVPFFARGWRATARPTSRSHAWSPGEQLKMMHILTRSSPRTTSPTA